MRLPPFRLVPRLALGLALLAGATALPGADSAPGPVAAGRTVLAHWAFDDVVGPLCLDDGPAALDAAPEYPTPGLRRVPGLFGSAQGFAGSHKLRVAGGPAVGGTSALSLTAWVLPADLTGFREILRKEDADQRILFSFQGDGTILSLGLNVGGYVECDAPVNPSQVLDGRWHLCAATFDGQTMRVYLDGAEIGSLDRPGAIAAGGPAPTCIGSSEGGECFQGQMDELTVYAEALTAAEIADLYRSGTEALARLGSSEPDSGPGIPKRLAAHWAMDEPSGLTELRDTEGDHAVTAKPGTPLFRAQGVHGGALALQGPHAVSTARGLFTEPPAGLSCSVWVRPVELGGFREILRQESDQRLLLSFQEGGAVLSLGLSIGGYVECDAAIDAARVADGQWHHCAGTFDGQTMRVFFDGSEVGSLQRPGSVSVDVETPVFIGSLSGELEHFQGSMDDLRVYAEALTEEDVATLYRAGAGALQQREAAVRGRLEALYQQEDTLARTMAGLRRRVVDERVPLDQELADAVSRKLASAFPDESRNFSAWTGMTPLECVASRRGDALGGAVERLAALMVEYRPLTEEQWSRQSDEDRRRWAEVDAVKGRVEALLADDSGTHDWAEWVDAALDLGRRVSLRPYIAEPVAPYVKPETPETRRLTESEAREALERDWLHQAGGAPTPERIRQEIGWAQDLARRLRSSGLDATILERPLAELELCEGAVGALTGPSPELYFRVRAAKRRIAFANPALDFTRVLFVDMPYPQGSEWPHETRHRLGYMAVPGARLMVLDGLSPDGVPTQLMPKAPLHGSFWRPDVSFDGQRVLFCFKPHNEKSFHLYEINADGTGLKQLTEGPYDDLDPIYLPDGHIMFCTTRANAYVRCMPPTNAYMLARCDGDGRNIYLISPSAEPEYLPSVASDGRVMYTRWEYTDKPLWRAQGLWTINPDGTHASTLWGNQSVWPDLLKDVRSIPGSPRVMFTGSAHHGWFSGSVGIIDPSKGFNFPNGLTKVTADVEWPESGNGPVDPVESPDYHSSGAYGAYYSPYPLTERDFLVSADRNGKFVLYLMDVDGNRELIYEGTHHVLHAIPLRPRPCPPVLLDTVAWPSREERLDPKPGIIYSSNVYSGAPDVLRGKAKYLRVLQVDAKTYTYWNRRPYISTGPVVSILQSEGVKRVLGTVPIQPDGSVSFWAPSGRPLHFQLLDGDQRALQTMRSFVGVMPGEKRGCLGCHELHSTAPAYESVAGAVTREPEQIAPPPWGEDTVSFARYVQPVLDRYCGACHQGDGEGRKVLDLTRRPGFLDFDEPYVTLTGHPTWAAPYEKPNPEPPGWGIADTIMTEAFSTVDPKAYVTPEPMQRLSYKSRLIQRASSGEHHGVKVDSESLLRLILWVDTMCPYLGDEEVRAIPDPDFQGIDWLAVRPRIATAPRVVRPGPVD